MADFINTYDKINAVLFFYAALVIFNVSTPKRRFWYFPFICVAAAVSAAHYFLDKYKTNPTVVDVRSLMEIALFVVGLGVGAICFKNRFADNAYKTMLAWVTQNLCGLFPILLAQIYTTYIINIEIDFLNFWYWFYKVAFVLAILAVCYFLIARKQQKPFEFYRAAILLIVTIVSVEVFLKVLTVFFLDVFGVGNEFKLFLSLSGVFVRGICLALLIVVYYALQTQKERDGINRLLAAKTGYYEMSKKNIEAINLKCHDLKHQIVALRSGVGGSDFLASLDDVERSVMIYDSVAKTGSEPLDVLLTEKSLQCEQKGIKLTYMVDGGGLDFMGAIDIYSMFGNAIENAIESAENISADRPKNIAMNVARRGDFLNIIIENTYSGDITVTDGTVATTKKNKDMHGFGIKSIRVIAEKYGGSINISAENSIFRLSIVIPIKD